MIITKALLLCISYALLAKAMPLVGESTDLVVLLAEEVEGGGTLTVYGAAPDSAAEAAFTPVLDSRQTCGSRTFTCYGSHAPAVGPCSQLISITRNDPNRVLSLSPRSICLNSGGTQCCISWSAPVQNLRQGSLTNAAQLVLDRCVSDLGQSGLTRNTDLQGTCATQCLSNRPDGCN